MVVDTRARALTHLSDPPPGPNQGSTPNALALSKDGSRLYVAEADNNAVAVFDLSNLFAGVRNARRENRLMGRIRLVVPNCFLLMTNDHLLVLNGKEREPDQIRVRFNRAPNCRKTAPVTPWPVERIHHCAPSAFDRGTLLKFTQRVARANSGTCRPSASRNIRHSNMSVYIIKESRLRSDYG